MENSIRLTGIYKKNKAGVPYVTEEGKPYLFGAPVWDLKKVDFTKGDWGIAVYPREKKTETDPDFEVYATLLKEKKGP